MEIKDYKAPRAEVIEVNVQNVLISRTKIRAKVLEFNALALYLWTFLPTCSFLMQSLPGISLKKDYCFWVSDVSLLPLKPDAAALAIHMAGVMPSISLNFLLKALLSLNPHSQAISA